MFPKLYTTTTALFGLTATSLLATQAAAKTHQTAHQTARQDSGSVNCTVFTWDNNAPYLAEARQPVRVSAGETCPQSNDNLTCALTASGAERVDATANLPDLALPFFVDVVAKTVDNATWPAPGFNDSVVGRIDATRMLVSGQSAYLDFTPYRFCYRGAVGNCTGGGVQEGEQVEVCAPVWHEVAVGDGVTLDGYYTVVNVSREAVEGGLGDPYEGQVLGNGEDGEGVAASLEMNGALSVLAGIVAGFLVVV
ncbi:hypothetical protein BJX61DRAFT_87891 [Aspergillus egyptiacus]|nr:hypothetical protein BJX61DRAFT_87891 [Aspergillus egyptiacus]